MTRPVATHLIRIHETISCLSLVGWIEGPTEIFDACLANTILFLLVDSLALCKPITFALNNMRYIVCFSPCWSDINWSVTIGALSVPIGKSKIVNSLLQPICHYIRTGISRSSRPNHLRWAKKKTGFETAPSRFFYLSHPLIITGVGKEIKRQRPVES